MTIYYGPNSGGTPKERLTTTQKQTLANAYKRFAIRFYKEEKIRPGLKVHVVFARFQSSSEYNNLAVVKKHGYIIISDKDAITLSKKAATSIRKSGYKVETEPSVLSYGSLSLWKVPPKR